MYTKKMLVLKQAPSTSNTYQPYIDENRHKIDPSVTRVGPGASGAIFCGFDFFPVSVPTKSTHHFIERMHKKQWTNSNLSEHWQNLT